MHSAMAACVCRKPTLCRNLQIFVKAMYELEKRRVDKTCVEDSCYFRYVLISSIYQ